MQTDGYLGSGIEVTDGISFKIILILPAEHSCDDDDDERYYGDRGQHCRDYPEVIRRVLDHSWKKEKQQHIFHLISRHQEDLRLND